MLIPKWGNRRFPSNVHEPPRGPASRQRDSRAFTMNQPSPSVTSPFLLIRSGASGTTSAVGVRERDEAVEHDRPIRELFPHGSVCLGPAAVGEPQRGAGPRRALAVT